MKALIWDFDGTLAYREDLWAGALSQAAFREVGSKAPSVAALSPHLKQGFPWQNPDEIYPIRSAGEWWRSLEPIFERAYSMVGATNPESGAWARGVRESFLDLNRWHVFPDVFASLEELRRKGWRHWILSNHVPELPDLVAGLGLLDFFEEVVTSAMTGYEKPHAEAFRQILRGMPALQTVWMIGDNPVADIAGAEAVGLSAILVRQRRTDVRYCCETLEKLCGVLGEFDEYLVK